jgi:hypothetical protein
VINLAGNAECDLVIEEELFVVGVKIVRGAPRGEVPTSLTGMLLGRYDIYTFRRAWRYWIVNGRVPIDIAERMYEQRPYGRRDVRVAGHCACPAPREWAKHFDVDDREISVPSEHDRELYAKYDAGILTGPMVKIVEDVRRVFRTVDTEAERDRVAVQVCVDSYHIDSMGGLKLFCDAVR